MLICAELRLMQLCARMERELDACIRHAALCQDAAPTRMQLGCVSHLQLSIRVSVERLGLGLGRFPLLSFRAFLPLPLSLT